MNSETTHNETGMDSSKEVPQVRAQNGLNRRTFLRGMMLTLAGGALSGCVAPAPTSAPASTPAPAGEVIGKRVIFGGAGEPTTFDPHVQLTGIDEGFLRNVYDGLIDWTGRPGEYEPALATEWSVAEDEMTWTFKLRDDVTFHDGSPFNAEVVKFNIDRGLENISWRWEPFVESVTVVDEYTVEIKTPKPHSGFLDHISWGSTVFHSIAAFEEYGEDLRRNPVGTGPFIFESWESGVAIVLRRNPDYWRTPPSIEGLEYRPIPEYSARVLALEAGDVDQIVNINVADIERLRQNSDLRVDIFPSVRNMFMQPNLAGDLMAKREVRQALNYAVDRESLANNLMAGITKPSYSAFNSANFGFIEPNTKYVYDPEKAKELLAEAGVEPGTKLVIMHTEGRYYGDRQVAEALQAMYNAVGFDTELWQLDWPTYAEYMWTVGPGDPNVDRRNVALTDYGAQDPNYAMFSDFYSAGGQTWAPNGGNTYFNDTPELDALIDEAWLTLDPDRRKEIFADIQNYIADEALRVTLMESSQTFVSKAGLGGFVALPSQAWNWRLCTFTA